MHSAFRLPLLLAGLLVMAVFATSAQARSADRDHDKMPDRWEKAHKLNPKVKDGKRDKDKDGLSNYGEYRAKTDPRDADTDNDGTGDAAEDRDRDTLTNGNEIKAGTDPRTKDSDKDGVRDDQEDSDRDGLDNAEEQDLGDDPGDSDSDDDGIKDGHEGGGEVVSFDGTTLVLKLADGTTLTGPVTADSEIQCEQREDRRAVTRSRGEDTPDGSSCAALLVAGATVKEAKLESEDGAPAFFKEIKILTAAVTSTDGR